MSDDHDASIEAYYQAETIYFDYGFRIDVT